MYYDNAILDSFYKALFATDEFDYETGVQNDKTDMLLEFDSKAELRSFKFEQWLDRLVDDYIKEQEDLKEFACGFEDIHFVTKEELQQAIASNSKFRKDIREEFQYLKTEAKEYFD